MSNTRGAVAIFCMSMALALGLATLSAPASSPATGGYLRPDVFAREDHDLVVWDTQQQDEYDEFLYLPLVMKRFCNRSFCPDNRRFGFGAVRNPVDAYDVAQLNAGWYVTFGFWPNPTTPAGLEVVQTIRLCEPEAPGEQGLCWPSDQLKTCSSAYSPNQQALEEYAAAHPGALWLIGNEPDAPAQDCISPGRYAELYHDLYDILKTADPTARVAIGGVVQGTPLRLQYLDMILQEYKDQYCDPGDLGCKIPVDIWNVHGFILQELRGSWGCQIPRGIAVNQGMLYTQDQHDNMDIFQEQIVRFRQWMKDRGEQNKPLVVTEYGILFGENIWPYFTESRVKSFMLATFDYFVAAKDASLGYPEDDNRLVQAWCWYSLDDNNFEQPYNITKSHLFDPNTYAITALGTAFGNYVSSLP